MASEAPKETTHRVGTNGKSQGLDLWVRGWLLTWLTRGYGAILSIVTIFTLILGGIFPVIQSWLRDELSHWWDVAERLGGVWPRLPKTKMADYGPSIKREHAPELFAEIHKVAKAVGVRPPESVRLAGLPCCSVTAWDQSRTLIVGLPLFPMLELGELRSILAHELAHLAWGDATRISLALRFVEQLGEQLAQAPKGFRQLCPPRWCSVLCWKIGVWLAEPISNGIEDRADQAAAKVAGGPAAASALIKTALVQPLFREAAAFYKPNRGLTLFAFFRDFLNRLPGELLAQMRLHFLALPDPNPDDHLHPPLRDRVHRLQSFPERNGQFHHDPASVTLGDLEALERLVHEHLFGPLPEDEGPSVFHKACT